MSFCTECGTRSEGRFCPQCGRPMQVQPGPEPAYAVPTPQDKLSEPVFAEKDGTGEQKLLTPWQYFGYSLLFMIPVIGWIFFIVFTFSKKDLNRRSWVRSIWCGILFSALLIALLVLVFKLVPGAREWLRAWMSV